MQGWMKIAFSLCDCKHKGCIADHTSFKLIGSINLCIMCVKSCKVFRLYYTFVFPLFFPTDENSLIKTDGERSNVMLSSTHNGVSWVGDTLRNGNQHRDISANHSSRINH